MRLKMTSQSIYSNICNMKTRIREKKRGGAEIHRFQLSCEGLKIFLKVLKHDALDTLIHLVTAAKNGSVTWAFDVRNVSYFSSKELKEASNVTLNIVKSAFIKSCASVSVQNCKLRAETLRRDCSSKQLRSVCLPLSPSVQQELGDSVSCWSKAKIDCFGFFKPYF